MSAAAPQNVAPPEREFLSEEAEREALAQRAKRRGDSGDEVAANLAVGRRGEDLACRDLWRRGFRIVARNLRIGKGEIDIVAEKRGRVHFIEVKTRTSTDFGPPEERVDQKKRRMLRKTAQAYLDEFHDAPSAGSQFDVIAQVLDQRGRATQRTLFENAF